MRANDEERAAILADLFFTLVARLELESNAIRSSFVDRIEESAREADRKESPEDAAVYERLVSAAARFATYQQD